MPNLDIPAPARYYVFAPATAITTPTPAQLADPANYVRVEINRDRPMSYPKASTRTDCAGSTCTWDEEAQNFANWFTYYRTRLSSAIAVTAESLSGLTRDAGLDNLRLAYGSINYFPSGANPYGTAGARLPSTMSIDGQPSNGALVRGVRPFTEVTPPPAPGSNDRRQEVFDWLFSLRAVASTPNRESLDSVGRYFQRSDNRGPWIQPTNPSSWTSGEDPGEHISCRRNYTIMITDGEWTRAPWVPAAPQQPLVENTSTQLNALSTSGPTITGIGGRKYSYNPSTEVQFSTNAGSGGTLSDIALYYWSRDLRTDLTNSIRPVDPTAGSQGNPAFWQHLTPYLIGYGISATLDNASTRQTIISSATAPQAITWPSVRLESRPAEDPSTIVTDRDTLPINCNYDPVSNPAGCGRVDDTFRAGMAARGDFLAATDVATLAQGIAAAFGRINEIEGTATNLTGRSGTIQPNDRLFAASFRTNVWTGRLQSFDAMQFFNSLSSGSSPTSIDSRFPAAASRNILTSTAVTTAAVFPTGAADFTNLSPAQRADLNDDVRIVRWVRGDQTVEATGLRERPAGEIMGAVVNSQPIYSKATDHGYQATRRPAGVPATAPLNSYRDFLNLNRSSRPARVYVGSNGGMVHAFDVSGTPATNANYMNEVFAYVPRATYPLLSSQATGGFRYLVDGPLVEGDVYLNGAWRTVLVGSTGAGPKGVFALDITQRSGSTATSMGTGNVLWDVAGTDTATNIEHLGHMLQPGVIGSGRDGNWYYFVGNGYESTNDKARLLAINLADGSILAFGPSGADDIGGADPFNANVASRPNGLGGVTPVYDGNRNIVAIYAGDRLGRVMKFDLSAWAPNSRPTSTTILFTAENGAGERQPITAAPRVMSHPLGGRMVVFGTGKLYEKDDTADNTVQSVYGVWERNTSSPVTVSKASMRQFSLTDRVASTGERFRQLNGTAALNWTTDNGWYFDLIASAGAVGERVIASPVASFGFANVTTFEPTSQGDPCLGGGRSFFYRLDVGGSFTRTPFANEGAVSNLPSNVPLSSIVASELPGGTVSGGQSLVRAVAGTTATSNSLTDANFGGGGGQPPPPFDNPCDFIDNFNMLLSGQGASSQKGSCPITNLRVWRDLPRTQTR
ncbi:MAG: PilC/PilY family type IV pilus protein [Burkholderiaceae bacterium]|nr:PilC/PilY family type IV pilus protein [Burkholderiaceae bacterium]